MNEENVIGFPIYSSFAYCFFKEAIRFMAFKNLKAVDCVTRSDDDSIKLVLYPQYEKPTSRQICNSIKKACKCFCKGSDGLYTLNCKLPYDRFEVIKFNESHLEALQEVIIGKNAEELKRDFSDEVIKFVIGTPANPLIEQSRAAIRREIISLLSQKDSMIDEAYREYNDAALKLKSIRDTKCSKICIEFKDKITSLEKKLAELM